MCEGQQTSGQYALQDSHLLCFVLLSREEFLDDRGSVYEDASPAGLQPEHAQDAIDERYYVPHVKRG